MNMQFSKTKVSGVNKQFSKIMIGDLLIKEDKFSYTGRMLDSSSKFYTTYPTGMNIDGKL